MTKDEELYMFIKNAMNCEQFTEDMKSIFFNLSDGYGGSEPKTISQSETGIDRQWQKQVYMWSYYCQKF